MEPRIIDFWQIMALRAVYDGSCKAHDPNCRFLNLGSFVGAEDAWAAFKSEWLQVLEKRAAPTSARNNKYFHSKKAMHNHDGYAGWNSERVSALVVDLLNALASGDRADPLAISCSVNLDDYRKVKKQIPALRAADLNGGAIIDHEAPRERRFVAVEK